MTAEATTLAGRTAAEELMVDECLITRGTTQGTFNTTTLEYDTVAATEVYDGKCRVKPTGGQASDRQAQAGERQIALWPFTVSVPISVTGIQPDDLVTVTASSLDADLVGLQLRVRSVVQGTHITARRLGCEVTAR